jgi:transposase
MKLYCGIDLHSNNLWLTIIDECDRRVVEKRIGNDLDTTLAMLAPYRSELKSIAVESTFNWYWLVDGLMAAGYEVKLVNTCAVKKYEGLKHADDRHDAFHLAQLLRLGVLPTGCIFPKELRGLRDLLRQRSRLVRQRTMHLLTVKSCYARCVNVKVKASLLKATDSSAWPSVADAQQALAIEVHRPIIAALNTQIEHLEAAILRQTRSNDRFQLLDDIYGIGPILAWHILLESGEMRRFATVGRYTSYCRLVPAVKLSNGKKKGVGNRKNGNAYLAWAYHEAAHMAIRFMVPARRYYERKSKQRNRIVAMKALAHKLARACYFVLRDGVAFKPDKLFSY